MRVLGQRFANMADEAAQMGAHFDAGRRLAGPQHDRDWAASARCRRHGSAESSARHNGR